MNAWTFVRVSLVVAALFMGALNDGVAVAPREGVSVSLLAAVFGFGVVGILLVVGMQRINPLSAASWRYPAWSISPFLFGEPLQFFHLGGFFFLATGLGAAIRELMSGRDLSLSAAFLPAFGAGMLCGVYACTWVYRSKMQ